MASFECMHNACPFVQAPEENVNVQKFGGTTRSFFFFFFTFARDFWVYALHTFAPSILLGFVQQCANLAE